MSDDDNDCTPQLQDIVYSLMLLMSLEYHAYSSAFRTASSSGEAYLRNKRSQSSAFVTLSRASDPSSLVYSPAKGKFVTVKSTNRSLVPYTVSVPARIVRLDGTGEGEYTLQSFHDNPCEMESTARHPGTTMDSDAEEDEDIKDLYPEYKPTETWAPITTTAAEQLFCIAFAGNQDDVVTELRAAYPLQLSARIDESRKFLIFDCFEYKPKCFDPDDPDLNKYLPIQRSYERWGQAFMSQDIKNDEDDYEDDDDDSFYTSTMEAKEGTSFDQSHIKFLIHNGLAGDFAYSRCLRFRFPISNIVGIRLQQADPSSKMAVLILEVSRPPPQDAFAARKVHSRWAKEDEFVLIKDWTPNSAASKATRIYLYGSFDELKQTAALMAKKCPKTIGPMLASKSCKDNTLRDGVAPIEYSAAPDFLVSENVSYGENGGRTRPRRLEDLSEQERDELRSDCRNALCRHCGTVHFTGHTGFPCPGCGDGRWTRNFEPASTFAFNGRIDNALEVFEAKCKRLDEEKRGSELKRKVLG